MAYLSCAATFTSLVWLASVAVASLMALERRRLPNCIPSLSNGDCPLGITTAASCFNRRAGAADGATTGDAAAAAAAVVVVVVAAAVVAVAAAAAA